MKELLVIFLIISGLGMPIALYIINKKLEKDKEIQQV